MSTFTKCFVGVGGNFEKSFEAFQSAFSLLHQTPQIQNLCASKLYRTSAVCGKEFQKDYLNCVFSFQTSLSLEACWHSLCAIEVLAGKTAKPKNAPRLIDLDLLFFGNLFFHSEILTIPHPMWHSRLFVVAPLSDLVEEINLPFSFDLEKLRFFLSNKNEERVEAISNDFSLGDYEVG